MRAQASSNCNRKFHLNNVLKSPQQWSTLPVVALHFSEHTFYEFCSTCAPLASSYEEQSNKVILIYYYNIGVSSRLRLAKHGIVISYTWTTHHMK